MFQFPISISICPSCSIIPADIAKLMHNCCGPQCSFCAKIIQSSWDRRGFRWIWWWNQWQYCLWSGTHLFPSRGPSPLAHVYQWLLSSLRSRRILKQSKFCRKWILLYLLSVILQLYTVSMSTQTQMIFQIWTPNLSKFCRKPSQQSTIWKQNYYKTLQLCLLVALLRAMML